MLFVVSFMCFLGMDHGIYIFLSLSLLNFVVSHERDILLLYSYKNTIVYYFFQLFLFSPQILNLCRVDV